MKRLIALLIVVFLCTASVFAHPFTDVAGHWAEAELDAAYESGIINGDGDGTFRPDDSISRAEFVKMLAAVSALNYLEVIPDELAETDHWASKYYVFAKNLIYEPLTEAEKVGEIIPGVLTDADIDAPIQRWEMAFMVGKAFENLFYITDTATYGDEALVAESYPAAVAEAVGVCVNAGIIRGDEYGNFNPGDGATRAEAAAVMNRMDKKMQELINQR